MLYNDIKVRLFILLSTNDNSNVILKINGMHFKNGQRGNLVYMMLLFVSMSLLIFAIYLSLKGFSSDINKYSNLICQKTFKKSQYSSVKDVIFFMATKNMNSGLKIALKSLKSTGCRAKVVLFTDIDFNLSIEDATFLKDNKIDLYKGNLRYKDKKIIPHLIRYIYEREWLSNHTYIKRVLHSDGYDVFFQKDPFSVDSLSDKKITFVIEPHSLRSSVWNQNSFKKCYGDKENLVYKNEFIICSGSIIGNATEYRKFLDIMLNLPEWKRCYWEYMDQPIINHLVWSGELKKRGVNYKFTGCDGGFMTVQWCLINQMLNINDRGNILSPSGMVPAFIHQYNKIEKLEKYLYNSCQM